MHDWQNAEAELLRAVERSEESGNPSDASASNENADAASASNSNAVVDVDVELQPLF